MADGTGWDAGTWEGNRRDQIRRTLGLSVRERLEALEELAATGERLDEVGERRRARSASGGGGPAERTTSAAPVTGVRESPAAYSPADRADLHSVELPGCRPTPLASYLKALGVLRLVTEQVDPRARGAWEADRFVLYSHLDRDAVREFLFERYQPTPILAPWNGGSGFYPAKDNTDGIDTISGGAAERLRPLRETIEAMRACLADLGITEKPGKEAEKVELLEALRSELPDDALTWMDAAVLLTDDGPSYPPLLGTGGNDGRLEFSNNFMQRVVEVIDAETGRPWEDAAALLDDALFASPVPALSSNAIGQFAPGAAGGPNASTGFEGGALVNPWDFILMLEGATLFAAVATRRLETTGSGQLSYPFTVRPTGAGSGGAALDDEGTARAEMWVPLWTRPMRLLELRALLGEGRVVVGRRVARDGVDFVRAVAQLGVERGIAQFQRYSFMRRFGRTYLATPLNRIVVRRNPTADLIDQLDRRQWLTRFRRLGRPDEAPGRLKGLRRRLDDALFDLARTRPDDTRAVQAVLIVLGEVQRYMATSPAARERCPPVPRLGAAWVHRADDGSDEFRLATALAGLHARRVRSDGSERTLLPFAVHLAPIGESYSARWTEDHHRVVWGHGSLARNLAAVLERRLLDADRLQLPDLPLAAWGSAPLAAVSAWLRGGGDADRIAVLLQGLALARTPQLPDRENGGAEVPVPAAYAVLKPLFTTDARLHALHAVDEQRAHEHHRRSVPTKLLRLLAAEDVDAAIDTAVRRLRVIGFAPIAEPSSTGIDASRLLAALMVPLSTKDLDRLLRRTVRRLDDEDADTLTPTEES